MIFIRNLHIEIYDYTFTNGKKGFYVGVEEGGSVYNLRGVRLKNEYSKFDFEEFKKDIKIKIKKYKKMKNVIFIVGYKDLIKSITEDFKYNIN